jgi:hypothetical protein
MVESAAAAHTRPDADMEAAMASLIESGRTGFRVAAHPAAALLMALSMPVGAGEAAAEPAVTEVREAIGTGASTDELKRLYLGCSRSAESGRLASAHIAQCSVVYELLKRHAFDGDFDRLLAWSRSQR